MVKYLPKNGKVCENNECLMALVIFADLSVFWKIFPNINYKLIKGYRADTTAKLDNGTNVR